jgi:transposase
MSNLEVLNALLYVLENGCKWRALPSEYGKWHTVYTRLSRWSKSGVLQEAFLCLQKTGAIRINVRIVSLDSTRVKVHPDGMGALKKEENSPSGNHAGDGTLKFIWSPHLNETP